MVRTFVKQALYTVLGSAAAAICVVMIDPLCAFWLLHNLTFDPLSLLTSNSLEKNVTFILADTKSLFALFLMTGF